jgi:hypothetical protein
MISAKLSAKPDRPRGTIFSRKFGVAGDSAGVSPIRDCD